MATHGAELAEAADAAGVDLFYEAAVAAAIPLLRPLRESLAGDRIRRVLGIVNGTTNYMLTKMDEQGASYDEVLVEAQRLGYAEADPTADVEGEDSAAKAAILATLAFHTNVTLDDVYREGITKVTPAIIESAREMGFVIKLLAVVELTDDAGVIARVHPAMVPRTHPLASVRDAFNAVFVEAEAAGEMMFYGQGAGGQPTASAVLGDVIAAARNRFSSTSSHRPAPYADLSVRPVGESKTRYTMSVDVADRPGVLAALANVFADNGVSIQTLRQDQNADGAKLVVRTHVATESDLSATAETLRALDVVDKVSGVMRVEGESGS
ncbi:MAG: homoserine dehydrogenase [Actinomycetes bacterium]|jgi:homoserine dehydrogenase